MKKMFCAVAMIALFTVAAMAADSAKPTQHYTGGETVKVGVPSSIVTVCTKRNCFFYGGDLNVNDTNAAGLSDENSLFIPDSLTYAPITPATTETVHGIFFNIQTSDIPTAPFTGSYDIRTGVSEGNGGTSVGSGTNVTIGGKNTGRTFIGVNEFSVVAIVNPPVTLQAGTTYWFNVVANCTNSSDSACSSGRGFVSNTTQETNAINGSWQNNNQLYLNSAFFGFSWANWCDSSLGLNTQQCADLSFGLF